MCNFLQMSLDSIHEWESTSELCLEQQGTHLNVERNKKTQTIPGTWASISSQKAHVKKEQLPRQFNPM